MNKKYEDPKNTYLLAKRCLKSALIGRTRYVELHVAYNFCGTKYDEDQVLEFNTICVYSETPASMDPRTQLLKEFDHCGWGALDASGKPSFSSSSSWVLLA